MMLSTALLRLDEGGTPNDSEAHERGLLARLGRGTNMAPLHTRVQTPV